jgi:LAS superfamily LD-carboxypeptidase LdcB
MRSPTGALGTRRRRLRTIATALLVVLPVLVAAPAGADPSLDQLKAQRADVLQKKAAAAAKVDALKANDAQVNASLDTLQADVSAQSAAMQRADKAAQAARAAASDARNALAAADAEVAAASTALKAAAVAAYAQGPSRDLPSGAPDGDVNDTIRAQAYGDLATGARTDALDALGAAQKDRAAAERRLKNASQIADRQLAAAQARLASLNAARAQQLSYADQVAARLDQQLSEAAALQNVDAGLANQITQREAAIAARLAAAAPRGGSGGPVTVVGDGDIVSVRGIQVAKAIADNLARMLSAADGAGLTLGGGGYRSSSEQVALRRAHCGSSSYAIYQAPASSCHPPTARPGSSMHERGLAIDFTCNGGGTIGSHSSPCWQWLNAHAASYGFYNLPSEAWHWSTNGN